MKSFLMFGIFLIFANLALAATPDESYTTKEHDKFEVPFEIQRGGIVTYNDCIYYAYVDPDLKFWIEKIDENGEHSRTLILEKNVNDEHNTPSVGIDKDGYIHVAGNMHNDPWYYKVSDNPEDISSFSLIASDSSRMIPGQSITYPFFQRDNNGVLYISFRMRVRMTWDTGVLAAAIARYDADSRTWTMLGGNDYDFSDVKAFYWEEAGVDDDPNSTGCEEGAYQPYRPHLHFDKNNRMHVSWVVDDSKFDQFCSHSGHHTHVLYAYSDDGGETFHKADGSSFSSMPIRLADADVVVDSVFAEQIGGISYTSDIEVMPDGTPYVEIETEKTGENSNYLSHWNGGEWTEPVLIPSAFRGHFLIDTDGVITSVGADGHGGLSRSFDGGQTWKSYLNSIIQGHSTRFDYEYFKKTNQIRFFTRSGSYGYVYDVSFSGSDDTGPDDTDSNDTGSDTTDNQAPIAKVGHYQVVKPGSRVTLDSSKSFDPDGDTLTYQWQQIHGAAVELDDAAGAAPTFIAPTKNTILVFKLVVNDGVRDSKPARIFIGVRSNGVR